MGMKPPQPNRPRHLELKKTEALTIHWVDGRVTVYPVKHLRRLSPAADARQQREELAANPLAVLPASAVGSDEPLSIERLKLVGRYAIQIFFSDGHSTGIYSWEYLQQIDPTTTSPD
jgi:DUF971 family protein